jgi:hypothetical protein
MMTTEMKKKVLAAMAAARENFAGSDAKFAVSLGINSAQYSRVKNGETERVLSDQNWISLARHLGVNLNDAPEWKTAATPVFQFITAQLEMCQKNSMSAMLCDLSDIGKTYTAQHYAKTHRNAVYVDCSQVKSKTRLIRTIAKSFGVGSTGRFTDVYEDLVYYLKTLPDPLVILDEAGDLYYEAFLEIKAMWNATDGVCGWYMMGADGLKAKIQRAIENKKVGYTELFSRFGKRYGTVIPIEASERLQVTQATAMMIIKANCKEGTDTGAVLRRTLGDDGMPSLRRIYKELMKEA